MKSYVEKYYILLQQYYNDNKLKINPDKTKYIIISDKKIKNIFNNFTIKADKYHIKPSNNIKILGMYLSNDLSWDCQIGKLTANLHNRVFNINKLKKYTNFKTRLSFVNAYVIGKLRYMMPLYSNATCSNINRVHKLVMRAARTSIGSYCCRKSVGQILKICGWLPPTKMITHSAIVTLHSIIINRTPNSIMALFNNTTTLRTKKDISTKYIPRTSKFIHFYINSGLKLYNKLPHNIKHKSKNVFKKLSKKWILNYSEPVSDTND